MFQRILVPVDLTTAHDEALRVAAHLARQEGGEVILIHVIELIPGLPREEEKEFYDRLERRADRHLAHLGRQLDQLQARWSKEIRYGNRAREVVRFADQAKIDLIALSSHKVDPDNPGLSWGTMSYKIGILSQCPVLLVK